MKCALFDIKGIFLKLVTQGAFRVLGFFDLESAVSIVEEKGYGWNLGS